MQLVEEKMIKLDRICREANVMLVFARSYGLTGLVRVSLKVGLNTLVLILLMDLILTIGSCISCLRNFYLVVATLSGQNLRYASIGIM